METPDYIASLSEPLRRPQLGDDIFPPDPFSLLPEEWRADPRGSAGILAKRLFRLLAPFRDNETVLAFLAAHPPQGRIALYPAGAATRAAIPLLRDRDGVEIVALLDRAPPPGGNLDGVPVLTPDAFLANAEGSEDRERIWILHPTFEARFLESLLELGVAPDRIGLITGSEAFYDWWAGRDGGTEARRYWADRDQTHLLKKTRNLVVIPQFLRMLPEADLEEIFVEDDTLVLCYGADPERLNFSRFPLLACPPSVEFLKLILSETQADVVYLSSLLPEHYLAPLIHALRPEARLIHEIYDWVNLFPDDYILPSYRISGELVQASRFGEYYSSQCAAAVVSKRSGPFWQRLQDDFTVPYIWYLQGAIETGRTQISRPRRQRENTKLGLVYAGPLPLASDPNHPFYRFLPLLDAVAKAPEVRFELFASSHLDGENDDLFKPYAARFDGANSRYHARLPLAELVVEIAGFDYGFMALNNAADVLAYPDTRAVISARATGYLSAGLPIVIDETWTAIVELVETFEAGIVVKDPNPETVVSEILSRADPAKHRLGAERLRDHLLARNKEALREIASAAGYG